MKHLSIFSFFLFLTAPSLPAHPAWGLAIADNGDIYFTDVLHHRQGALWKIDTEGKVSTVITDYHAHDMHLDRQGRLWLAENRWIQGEIEGEGLQTLIRIHPNGSIDTLIRTDDWDAFYGGAFTVDEAENIYFSIHEQVLVRRADTPPVPLFKKPFGRLADLFVDAAGSIWFADKRKDMGTLYRWNREEGLQTVATHLMEASPQQPVFEETRLQLLYGIAQDPGGNIYVADNASRVIWKIVASGEKSVFYTSDWPWHPIGMDFYQDHAVVMESGFESGKGNLGPRVWRYHADGSKEMLFDYETYVSKDGSHPVEEMPQGGGGPWGFVVFLALLVAAGALFYLRQKRLPRQPA